jgi:hypothetical protein
MIPQYFLGNGFPRTFATIRDRLLNAPLQRRQQARPVRRL